MEIPKEFLRALVFCFLLFPFYFVFSVSSVCSVAIITLWLKLFF